VQKRWRRGAALTLVLLVAGVGAWWLWAGRDGAVAPSASAQQSTVKPPTPVETVAAEIMALTDEVVVAGALRSNESVNVSTEIAGVVSAIHFEEGEPVEQGALLFELDASIWQAELDEADAHLSLSQSNDERARQLLDRRVGTVAHRDEAKAELDMAKAAAGLARARLDKTQIRAPFSGELGLRKVSIGEYVTPGQELVNLENLQPIKVDFRIAERYLSKLRTGQQVEIGVDSLPGRSFSGEVTAIDPRVDPESRSVAVRAQTPNQDKALHPGQFARVRLIVDRRDAAIVIPEQALVPQGEQFFVYKVIDGKAVMSKVSIGQRQAGQAEITEGLAEGDVVVTGGHQKIRDGAPVQPVDASQVS
jgi:membrane fusion protein (multidrug efflux system)